MVKLIEHTGECNREDDETLPVKLEMYLRTPEFMAIAYLGLYGGTERIVARAENVHELELWMKEKHLDNHPRLSRYQILESDKVIKSHKWS